MFLANSTPRLPTAAAALAKEARQPSFTQSALIGLAAAAATLALGGPALAEPKLPPLDNGEAGGQWLLRRASGCCGAPVVAVA